VRYNSYVLRCWARTENTSPSTSFAVEHVQTGAQHRGEDLRLVIAWIEEHNRTVVSHPADGDDAEGQPAEEAK
jgi:hypothetical protein